ncbi:glucosamine-6-phosphate deaminase [Sporosarcina globispora]|uniref:Glucosamine-6-phosphate deaminase n=1 Tax=Sporosarcina globispora TaxID=1459 RepID=A0A0M0GEP4_SPOGL|nr:glucosamine-6-phosphate deaminase [Sporosarcina globispora]KON88248.1 glucosamine-6-phosphate deaminase [Sporosarcina globispora]
MEIIKVTNYEEMSKTAADYIITMVRQFPDATLGLATGGTPVGTYKRLIEDHQDNKTSYKKVTTFNLDEYIGLSGENPQSYRYFMDSVLFNHLDIQKVNTFIPNGTALDLEKECLNYENKLKNHGGIGLQILGIGNNGHIGFNEPGTAFSSNTHIVDLADSTIKANARYFNNIEEVPNQAITMGISTIMQCREILLLASGEAKADAIQQLLGKEVNEHFPASILRSHPNVKVIADEAALSASKVWA